MSPPISSPALIRIEDRCGVPGVAMNALRLLFDELIGFAGPDSTAHLDRVIVVPNGTVPRTEIGQDGLARLRQGELAPRAEVAMASAPIVETAEALRCFILLDCRLVRPLTAARYHFAETVSLLLEELLHARLSAIARRRRGFARVPDPGCTGQLFNLAAAVYDEYVVARWKAAVISVTPLIDRKRGGRGSAPCEYTIPLAPLLDRAGEWIPGIPSAAKAGAMPIELAWRHLLNIIEEFTLDPLARDAGYRAGNAPDTVVTPNDPAKSQFYRDIIHRFYWPSVLSVLERSFACDLADMDEAESAIAAVIGRMLADLRVRFRKQDNGAWWIQFD